MVAKAGKKQLFVDCFLPKATLTLSRSASDDPGRLLYGFLKLVRFSHILEYVSFGMIIGSGGHRYLWASSPFHERCIPRRDHRTLIHPSRVFGSNNRRSHACSKTWVFPITTCSAVFIWYKQQDSIHPASSVQHTHGRASAECLYMAKRALSRGARAAYY